MDIASALKQFMDYMGIQSSQFADTCGIPRPSLSQLLNGRNKKVSNEVIEKIHRAYPSLSISWLMFSEGSMLSDVNIETSGSKIEDNVDISPTLFADNEIVNEEKIQYRIEHEKDAEKFSASKTIATAPVATEKPVTHATAGASSVSLNVNAFRKVVNIVVFYSDNSFETFIPKE